MRPVDRAVHAHRPLHRPGPVRPGQQRLMELVPGPVLSRSLAAAGSAPTPPGTPGCWHTARHGPAESQRSRAAPGSASVTDRLVADSVSVVEVPAKMSARCESSPPTRAVEPTRPTPTRPLCSGYGCPDCAPSSPTSNWRCFGCAWTGVPRQAENRPASCTNGGAARVHP